MRIKPHHLVVALGVAIALFTAAVGHRRRDHRLPQRQPDHPRGLRQRPHPAQGRLLHRHPDTAGVRSRSCSPTGSRTGSGAGPTTAAPHPKNVHHRMADFRAGVYMQTLLREPGRGRDALAHLLQFPGAAGGDHHPGGRSPTAGRSQVPARRRVPGLLRGGRRGRGGVRDRDAVGHPAPLRAADVEALPHPHQDPSRARGHRRGDAGHRHHRVRRGGLPDRGRRSA